jgi:hypothetical protein
MQTDEFCDFFALYDFALVSSARKTGRTEALARQILADAPLDPEIEKALLVCPNLQQCIDSIGRVVQQARALGLRVEERATRRVVVRWDDGHALEVTATSTAVRDTDLIGQPLRLYVDNSDHLRSDTASNVDTIVTSGLVVQLRVICTRRPSAIPPRAFELACARLDLCVPGTHA